MKLVPLFHHFTALFAFGYLSYPCSDLQTEFESISAGHPKHQCLVYSTPVLSDTCKLQEQPPCELSVLPSFGDF